MTSIFINFVPFLNFVPFANLFFRAANKRRLVYEKACCSELFSVRDSYVGL
jgi:hypothetical protein